MLAVKSTGFAKLEESFYFLINPANRLNFSFLVNRTRYRNALFMGTSARLDRIA